MESQSASPEFVIIPTGSKPKIGKRESYVIGAEIISKALAGLPMFPKLQLSFGGSRGHANNPSPARLPVMAVQYRLEHWINGVVFGPSWLIGIEAVPREMKGLIKAQLLESGLERVRNWLLKHERVWGAEGIRRIEVEWDSDKKELQFLEFSSSGPKVIGNHREHT
jgi:hypothetical protein